MVPMPPSVPEADLEARGWRRTNDRTETVFEGLGVTVESRTLVYEDSELRSRVVDAGGLDRVWRFLFVARLEITPKPMFGSHAALRPRVLREAKQTFATELRERGIEGISVGNDERTELAGGRRARLVPYRGRLSVEDDDGEKSAVDIVGRLALWYDDGFYLAGVAGPSGEIDGWVETETDARELLESVF
jgi:hypothetical protein